MLPEFTNCKADNTKTVKTKNMHALIQHLRRKDTAAIMLCALYDNMPCRWKTGWTSTYMLVKKSETKQLWTRRKNEGINLPVRSNLFFYYKLLSMRFMRTSGCSACITDTCKYWGCTFFSLFTSTIDEVMPLDVFYLVFLCVKNHCESFNTTHF